MRVVAYDARCTMVQFKAPNRAVDRVFLHCSASDKSRDDDVEVIRRWHVGGNGWSDVGYHYFITKAGQVQEGRSLQKQPAAQKPHNRGTIAICCHGLRPEKFTRAQFVALIDLCTQIDEAYRHEVTFHGHREVSRKACPVYPYKEILGLDEDGTMAFDTNPEPTGREQPPSQDLPVLRLFAKGEAVSILQRALNRHGAELTVDGNFGRDTLEAVRAFQRKNGLGVDGVVGRKTWAKLGA